MIAAIYARKSPVQNGVTEMTTSVTRQVDHARAYAGRKGWTVADDQIYVGDRISGAEFENQPGYMRLLNALKPRAPFEVLIVSELSRLGREQLETGYAMKQLSQAGVRVYSHLADREVLLDTPTDKFLMSAVSFAAKIERDKARQRTYDAMVRKARAGHVTGGRVFGYDNVEILGSSGERSHVERRINDAEAGVVREIFELCARGEGLKGIAKRLNAAGAPTPRAQQGRPNGWAPSSVRAVLHRSLYRNRSGSSVRGRRARPAPRPDRPVRGLDASRLPGLECWAEFPVCVRDVLEPRGLDLLERSHGRHVGRGRGRAATARHRGVAAGRRRSRAHEGAETPAGRRRRAWSARDAGARTCYGRG